MKTPAEIHLDFPTVREYFARRHPSVTLIDRPGLGGNKTRYAITYSHGDTWHLWEQAPNTLWDWNRIGTYSE